MVSLTQLEYALAVEKHRHFGKASAACNVTQPTLSQQLQKLEDEIGLVLFDRLKKPILPTPEGKAFLDQARTVLREHQKLLHVSKQRVQGQLSGDFRLAIIPTVASDLLPRFIKPFAQAHTGVQLQIEEMKTETILSELHNDKLDGAILATPIEGSDFKVHPLYYEPFFAYFSPGHPLLKKSSIYRTDLEPSEMWLLQEGHCFKDQVLSFCSFPQGAESSHQNVQFRSGSLDTLKRLVSSSHGFTLIPAMMALGLDRKEYQAHVRPFRAPVPVREISFIYRRDHWKLEMIRALEAAVVESLPEAIPRTPTRAQTVIEVT